MEEGHARDTGRVLGAEAPFIYGVVIGNRPAWPRPFDPSATFGKPHFLKCRRNGLGTYIPTYQLSDPRTSGPFPPSELFSCLRPNTKDDIEGKGVCASHLGHRRQPFYLCLS